MKTALRIALALICIVVITVCAVLIVQKVAGQARMDLTQHGLYTLSDGTQRILGKLNQPVKLKLYFSRKAAMKGPEQIRFYSTYYLYVRAVLEEYVSLSRGKLVLELIDPRGYDAEEEAIQHNIRKFPMSEDENFFFGLVVQTELGKTESIPFFEPDRQEFVEYDVSKLIASVVQRDKKRVGVLSSLPVAGADMSPYMAQMMQMQGRQPPQPWIIVQQLREQYEVVPVKPDADTIKDDIDFLMVVHPKNLAEKTLFAIDQFVMKGGKLIVFIDPHSLADQPLTAQSNPYARLQHKANSDLNRLLKGWGVELLDGLIAGDRTLAIPVPQRNGFARLATYITLDERCVNTDEVITAKLHNVRMLFPGVLKKVPGATTAVVTPLLSTTDLGGTWKPRNLQELHMPDAGSINQAIKPAGKPVMVACRITGKLKTNFPDGIKADKKEPGEEDEEGKAEKKKAGARKPEVVKESPDNATVLVFADVDMISDMIAYRQEFFGVTPLGDNAATVLNAIDFLGGSGDLIAIRSRGRFNRPFLVVDKIEADAEIATAKEAEKLDKKIEEFRSKIAKLKPQADRANIALLKTEAAKEYSKLLEGERLVKKEKQKLNDRKREKLETLESRLEIHNILWAPAVVLAIAIALAIVRSVRARRYAARRM